MHIDGNLAIRCYFVYIFDLEEVLGLVRTSEKTGDSKDS